MAKMVIYNGGTESYYGCTDPTDLVRGQVYEVISERDRGFQTDYTLKGIRGHFNSCWFDEIPTEESKEFVFMALSHTIPEVGSKYSCFRIETNALNRVGEISLIDISSSHTTTACRSALGGWLMH